MLRLGLSVLSSATCFRMSRNSKPSEEKRPTAVKRLEDDAIVPEALVTLSLMSSHRGVVMKVLSPGSDSSAKAMMCSPSMSSS